ncbi:hypothetical protein BH09DEP1_BH09DEP1_4810 [soil metagenome]
MKKILLLALALTSPIVSMDTPVAHQWSWKGLVSNLTDTASVKPQWLGLGAAGLAVAAYGVYHLCKTKAQKPNLQKVTVHATYEPLLSPVMYAFANHKKKLISYASMLKKSIERDLHRLETMMKDNTVGDIAFDCVSVWNMHTELSNQLPLTVTRIYNRINRFSLFTFSHPNIESLKYIPLFTQRDVKQVHQDLKSLHRELEEWMKK